VFARFDYQDWGTPKPVNQPGDHESLYGVDARLLQQFQGAFFDSDLAAYKFGDRWLSTEIKRWLSEDPAGLQFGGNPNAALNNSPQNFRDPTGKWWEAILFEGPSLVLGFTSLNQNINEGNFGGAMIDLVGILADGVALALPIIPGGAGTAIKAARAANSFADANRALQGTNFATRAAYRTSQGVQTLDLAANGYQFYDAHQRGDGWGMFLSSTHLTLRGLQGIDRLGYEVQSLGLLMGPGLRIRAKAVALKGKYRGGLHGSTKGPVGDGLESHHMPAKSVNGLHPDKGPAIQMEPADHALTASHGTQAGHTTYRLRQARLIKKGKFGEAIQLDINNVRKLFDNKYDEAIQEMINQLEPWMKKGISG